MVEVRDAATVMLVRDGDAGMEVLMLMRNLNSDFVGGAYVFPGGAVDPHDRHEDLSPYCLGRNDTEASERLGIESGGLAFWVAAVRECFEEAGILLAYNADGEMVRLDDPAVEARFVSHRASIDKKERRLIEVCDDEGLKLAVDRIHYFSHWITPEGPPRRYDTRFFVARAPDKQVALHDDRETVANTWIRPQDALDAHERGEFEIIFPTIKNLSAIGRFDDADELVAAAANAATVPTVTPRIVQEGEQMRILLPGDPGY